MYHLNYSDNPYSVNNLLLLIPNRGEPMATCTEMPSKDLLINFLFLVAFNS